MTTEERLETYLSQTPRIASSAYVAKDAVILGAVSLGENCSVWHHAVLRADINSIEIGDGSNIQDGTVIHLSDQHGVKIGSYVTVGHAAIVHACEIGDECLIGMQATILDGATIGTQSIVGAGALVTKGTHIPEGSLVLGSPAKVIRPLTPKERSELKGMADKYITVSRAHKERFSS